MSRNPENTFPVCNVSGRKARLFILLALLIQLFSTGLLAAPKNAFGDVGDNEKFPIGWFSYQGFVWQWGSWGSMACPVNPGSINGGTAVCSGQPSPAISNNELATESGAVSGTIVYWWQYSLDNGANWTNIGADWSASASSLPEGAVNALTVNTLFRRAANLQDADEAEICTDVYTPSPYVLVVVNPLPSATISGTTTVCQGDPNPEITFTGSGGTTPYTFTYRIGPSGTPQTITTQGTNTSITIPVSTASSGNFSYELISVEDGSTTDCNQPASGSAIVTVTPIPATPT
ncbi:hypothetical protein, partial [Flavihumibacter sp. ZG627]|uniref:hypothetical protein n=1 Tax=Flavihumibacter sp. ZG627 TaxID=1463156 RepID=UPI00058080CC